MEMTDFEGEVNETILAPKSTRRYPIPEITMGINLDSKIQEIDQDLRRYETQIALFSGMILSQIR